MRNLKHIEDILHEIEALIAANGNIIFVNGPFSKLPTSELLASREFYQEYPPENGAQREHFAAVEEELDSRYLPRRGRLSAPSHPGNSGQPPTGHRPPQTNGFKSLGEFAIAARVAGVQGGSVDPRLIRNAPTTYGTEGVDADGGFAVPPDFRTEIKEKVMGQDSLLGRTDQIITASNSVTLPKDETTPWQTSGGLQAYWESEAGQLTESKPSLESVTFKTNKITALVPVTEELMEDAPTLDAYLRRKVPEKFDYKIAQAIIQGTGAGQPLGIINSGALVSVAKESAQSADTIQTENILTMFSRMDPARIEGACWIANPDTKPQLLQLKYDTSGGEVMPVFLPGGNMSGKPYATLLGLPILYNFACPQLGDKGDILLANLGDYMTIVKSVGIRVDVSMHLYFDYDLLAYRFVMRLTGQPWMQAPITAPDGTTTYSSFVTLDERS